MLFCLLSSRWQNLLARANWNLQPSLNKSQVLHFIIEVVVIDRFHCTCQVLRNLILAVHGKTLQWCHNERDGLSNHRRLECLLNRLFRRRSKKTSKRRVTGLCEGNSPVTNEFPAQRSSNGPERVRKCFHLMTSSWVVESTYHHITPGFTGLQCTS